MIKKIYPLIVLLLVFALLIPGSISSASDNNLFDGGFEQYPTSSWWYPSEPIGGVFMNSTLNNQNFFDNFVMPAPLCGHGIYNVGKTTYPLDFRNGSVPSYQFTWAGGTFYWQAAIKGPWFSSFFPVTAYSYADIYLLDSQSARTELLEDHQVAYGDDWARHYGSTSLAAGTYTLYMGRGASMEKTDAYFYKYQLFYDDVYVGSVEPSHSVCSDSITDVTPTFEPTQHGPTESPTPMDTPTGVMTPTTIPSHRYSISVDPSVYKIGSAYGTPGITACYVGDRQIGDTAIFSTNDNTHFYVEDGIESLDINVMYVGSACRNEFGYGFDGCLNIRSYGMAQPWQGSWWWHGSGTITSRTLWCYGIGDLVPTATPTLSPTPGPSPTQTTKLYNCGFELGQQGWYFTPPSYVDLAGGPSGPQHAVAVPNNQSLPEIFQNFYWPVTQPIYIQGWSKGQAQVRIWNIYSNFQYSVVYTGNDTDWVHWQYAGSLPMGYYRLELNTFDPEGSEGRYDGVTLAADNYLDDWVCSAATPTPGPTSFVTPTPGPSMTPSLTMTPRTSRTPWGTSTLWPSGTPSLSATAGNAQTLTAIASITPGGGGGSTVTPGPGDFVPPEQPPGGEGAPCQRPQTWQDSINLGWWIDYEVCDIKRFLSWGPSANATAAAIPTMFANKEPFHTIDGIENSFRGMQTQVASYAWDDTGFDGVTGDAETIDPRPDRIFNLLSPGVSQDPWSAGGTISFNQAINPNFFSILCTTRLSDILPARLSQGICFALNVTRSIGYLGWVQFLFNGFCIYGSIRGFLTLINLYGMFASPSGVANIVQNYTGGKNDS